MWDPKQTVTEGPLSVAAQLTCTAVGGKVFKVSVYGQRKRTRDERDGAVTC